MCGMYQNTWCIYLACSIYLYAIYHLLKTRDEKACELMNIVCVNLFIAWVKLVQNFMLLCQESE